jgi:hypothetical protein
MSIGVFDSRYGTRVLALWAILGGAYATGCGDETGDPRHREPGQVNQGLPKGTPGAANGQLDFCTGGAPCTRGEGDCDADSECAAGLVCGYDNLERFLPGACSGCDACVLPHCRDGIQNAGETGTDCGGADCGACLACPLTPNSAVDHCTTNCPCLAGEGDCDVNADCALGLVCGANLGPQFRMPHGHGVCVAPHCADRSQNADETGTDCGGADCGSCVTCATTPGANTCSPTCRCPAGLGDCDADRECQPGLLCTTGISGQFGISNAFQICAPAHCSNRALDAASGETGIDCGGPCGQCLAGPPDGGSGAGGGGTGGASSTGGSGGSAGTAGAATDGSAGTGGGSTITWARQPGQLVVDNQYVYFTEHADNTIQRVEKTGGSSVQLGASNAGGIAIDATDVYWIDTSGFIRRVAKSGGTPTIAAPAVGGRALVVDADAMYWVKTTSSWNVNRHEIYRALKSSTNPELLYGYDAEVGIDGGVVGGLVQDEDFLYWPTTAFGPALLKLPKGGGTATLLVSSFGHNAKGQISYAAGTLLLNTGPSGGIWDEQIYGVNAQTGQFWLVGSNGRLGDVLDIAGDATHAYWTHIGYDDSVPLAEVRRASTLGLGSETVLLESRTTTFYSIALDDDFIYYSTSDGAVSRKPK